MLRPCSLAAALIALSTALHAQPDDRRSRGGVELTAAVAATGSANLEGGGRIGVERHAVAAGTTLPVSRRTRSGIEIGLVHADYRFSGANALGGDAPWTRSRRVSVGVPLIHSLSNDIALFATLSASSSTETSADWNDGLGYGGLAVLNRTFSPDLRLGLGVAAFRNIETTDVFPVLNVEWRPGEHWWLGNPFAVGPVTPAGLELRWTGLPDWTLAAGASWRSERFRLDGDGVAPGGVAEVRGIPVFLRASHELSPALRAHVLAGVSTQARLRLEDRRGRGLASIERDTAPFVTVAIQGRF